ncbi:jg13781 [Pararge aegeria aegeria]|uniref:Jg13781 protein n=1 Tax=Pararge aegeria aegeria TaxID=348720 RepID=A0A8S4S941_9NEOP|nr:jg13781 [Pararge aegeria aegeria]
MNNKKNKSRTRSKTTKKSQESDNLIEKLEDSEKVNLESLNTDETRVPDVVTETVTITDSCQSTNDVPKKPKRSKSKKKKDQLFENVLNKEENVEEDIKENSDNVENISQENSQISPCVRKNKKKAKKSEENLERVNLAFDECTDTEPNKEKCVKQEINESTANNDPILQKDDATPKKKKKKKHRHDSEKSDKYYPCTLAFQNLIETPIQPDKSNDRVEVQAIHNDIVTEDVIDFQESSPEQNQNKEIKPEESKIKKKNKKAKKNPPDEHILSETTISEKSILSFSGDNNLPSGSLESEKNYKETSPKPKAKIIKPVQKKRQTKSESESQKPSMDENIETNANDNNNNEISKPVTIIKNTEENKCHPDNDIIKENITSSKPVIYDNNMHIIERSQSQLIKLEINEPKDSSPFTNISENKQEGETAFKNQDDVGYVKVRTVKGKKKQNKNTLLPDTPETIKMKSQEIEKDLDMSCMENKNQTKSEQVEMHKSIIPDLIEYPRSTSQQFVDSNNKTFIQEITSTEEVKLDSSHDTPTPLIQGSGESPEANTRKETVLINVTEIVSQPTNKDKNVENVPISEKTDIKSKMIEVNRDMEELRRSIERSLAELTAMEKSDTEVDKEFEELFQSQTADKTSIEITEGKIDDLGDSIKIVENSRKSENMNKNLDSRSDDVKPILTDEDIKNTTLVSNAKTDDDTQNVPPVCPARRDKNKSKSKKKGKKEVVTTNISTPVFSGTQTATTEKDTTKKSEKSEQKSENTQEKGKQQASGCKQDSKSSQNCDTSLEPIENFEDALTSSVDDINNTFEIIAKDAIEPVVPLQYHNNPKINIISPAEDNNERKHQNPITLPKNLLSHPNIPAPSNDKGFNKEKFNPPNTIQAKVKIKDLVEIEMATNNKSKMNDKKELKKESNGVDLTYAMKTNEDLIYKYSFRRVFLQSRCHVCKKDLVQRVPCKFCSLVFYCSQKHKDEDWSHHQSLCFAVSTIAHLREQKHIYADAQNILGHDYRVLRMQTILSCEKILNRKLVPWEQEALLYPRMCGDIKCRQWRQEQLKDCAGCGQISFCNDHPEHLPSSHQRWCKSYALYQKMVNYQLTKGRLEPPLPTRVLNHYKIPGKLNEVLGSMYKEKIDMDDIQYAALTQIATAPLTTAYSHQLYSSKMNSSYANGAEKNSTFTIHLVGIELPFEADSLNKWEKFFLHLRSDVQDLRVVMVGPDINSSKLPLDLLGKIKLCENCRTNKRRVLFDFHESYQDYYLNDGFVTPDIVCAFNPNIHRSSANNINTWPTTINFILKQRVPFVLTSYSIEELRRDLGRNIAQSQAVDDGESYAQGIK